MRPPACRCLPLLLPLSHPCCRWFAQQQHLSHLGREIDGSHCVVRAEGAAAAAAAVSDQQATFHTNICPEQVELMTQAKRGRFSISMAIHHFTTIYICRIGSLCTAAYVSHTIQVSPVEGAATLTGLASGAWWLRGASRRDRPEGVSASTIK